MKHDPKVGQRYRRIYEGENRIGTVMTASTGGDCNVDVEGESGRSLWSIGDPKYFYRYELIEATTVIDWTQWLPPRTLPYGPSKDLVPGQIWAWNNGESVGVVKVTGDRLNALGLAGFDRGVNCAFSPNDRARSAVLVQDVGQAEPTVPALLWARVFNQPWVQREATPGGWKDTTYLPDGTTASVQRVEGGFALAAGPDKHETAIPPGFKRYEARQLTVPELFRGSIIACGPHANALPCFDCHMEAEQKLITRMFVEGRTSYGLQGRERRARDRPSDNQSHVIGVGCIGTWATRTNRLPAPRYEYPEADVDADIPDAT